MLDLGEQVPEAHLELSRTKSGQGVVQQVPEQRLGVEHQDLGAEQGDK